ncbi:hypothetical protein PCANC_16201 [Puccinia coronata f. sp. avenae]|uniref:Threonine dehydratase n=1 Tax=Puccinia coronata f. sp. avenae TaxID=200324 RepID=A0A2N5UEE4_9BASI|nr:hypothetical protein PCANC_19610 [Puccinia coronata f. sp. avenae]PLW36125.1 hypothetical protein PCASD_11678 [Puccinia coronata f. sp. avenae]PLW36371.1 hypothetical protein PCANC_16201 [Puccinia coronata f. sp. avenae]
MPASVEKSDLPSAHSLQPALPSPQEEAEKTSTQHPHYARIPERQLLVDGTPDYIQLILSSKVYDVIKETPITHAVNLSQRFGVWIGMKREDLQPVFSFKIRGAYNLMAHLSKEEKLNGVIASSAGNHAQGVAMSAQALGIKATIVMPLATPSIKYRNVDRLGSTVLLHGNDFDEAKRECSRLAKEHQLTNIPPFDDPHVIAGQGTIGLEILNQIDMHSLDAIFVCVGGGGLLAGIAAYVKKIGPPTLKVIGVESIDQPAMTQSLANKSRITLNEVGLFSDGTAVRVVGEETFRLCSSLVDDMILVNNDELCAAIKDVFEDTRSIPEPAGALAVAGVKRYIQENKLIGSGKKFVSIVSGANMDFDRLRFVAERADLGEQREALLSVVVPEKPGSFVKLHSYLHPRPVTEFSYRFSSTSQAFIFVSFRLSSLSSATLSPAEARQQEIQRILQAVSDDPLGMKARDISNNEMAKSHARYLIGGRVDVQNERLISFTFPERPGALRKFLVVLSGAESEPTMFNITLFHYRNHGGDLSKVLAGIQVPPADQDHFESFLEKLGYPFTDETGNEVYKEFLLAK